MRKLADKYLSISDGILRVLNNNLFVVAFGLEIIERIIIASINNLSAVRWFD